MSAYNDTLPAGSKYRTTVQPDVLDTLRDSYRERDETNRNLTNGFDWEKPQANGKKMVAADRSFQDVLDAIGDQALEAVSGVYRDMLVVPGFWACIRSIRKIWRLTSNWGFSFNSSVRSTMEHLMQSSAGFCADFPLFQSDHQRNDLDPAGPCPHQCYRRIVHSPGPGAHVCIVGTGFEDAAGGPHEVHIDFHQLGAAKIDGTHCFYHYILDHFSDVGPHLIADSLLKERVLPALIRIASVGAASGHGRDFWAVYASHIGNMNTDELKRKLEREIPEVVSLIRRQPMGLAAEAGLDSILSRFMQLMHLLTTAGTNPFPCR